MGAFRAYYLKWICRGADWKLEIQISIEIRVFTIVQHLEMMYCATLEKLWICLLTIVMRFIIKKYLVGKDYFLTHGG